MTVDRRRRRRTSSSSATRRSSWRSSSSPPTSSATRPPRPTRRSRSTSRTHKETYRIAEKRKIRYLTIDQEAMRAKAIGHRPADRARLQRQHPAVLDARTGARQPHPAQDRRQGRRGREEAGRGPARARSRPGADFAELAKKYSQDEDSAKKGGDLDFFAKGRMVPEFDQVAFSMQPGQISDLVKSQFGYHIIKVTDKKPAATKPLAEVRSQIEDQLKWEQAQAAGAEARRSGRGRAEEAGRLRQGRPPRTGCQTAESGFFPQDEPIAGIGLAPDGRPAGLHDEGRGSQRADPHAAGLRVHHASLGKQDPYLPKLDEVKAKVQGRRHQAAGGRRGAAEGGRDRRGAEVGRLRQDGEGGRPRGQDDRSDRARRADRATSASARRSTRRRSRCRRAASATRSSPTTAPSS